MLLRDFLGLMFWLLTLRRQSLIGLFGFGVLGFEEQEESSSKIPDPFMSRFLLILTVILFIDFFRGDEGSGLMGVFRWRWPLP
mmetsp:Transcript_22182/g.63038  ORF Transcript_22182/g.63038 Transcript_22182/m.63038 type:complete len:83 (-) Transcript_22182:329-577(-)